MNEIRAYFERGARLRCLSISAIEREAGLPKYTLMHFLKGRKYRHLTPEQVEAVKKVLSDFGFIS